MSNYAENICESIEIISKSLLEGLSYDKTVVCTVIDDSKRSKGIYTVKEGMGATYEAYSENTQYRKNSQVYVTIPGNNYNNQKMITGKKVTEDNEPVIYSTPFDTIIDILDLRVPQAENIIGLLANCPNIPEEYPSSKRLFSMESYDKPYYGFSRLALRADFRSWLRETGCIEGNYGLKVTVDFATETTNETQTTYPVIRKELYLNVDDMIGNPYQFDTFFSQEKAFDISSYGGISAIFIDFYQKPDSFKINKKDENDEYRLLPYKDDFDGYLFNNLFVQNVQIAVGYDLGAYDNDFVQLYSFDQPNFSSKENEKSIKLKWIHLDGEKQIVMGPENTDYEYEIRWYRYIMGEQASDAYVTGGWVNINNPLNSSNFVFEAGQNQEKAYQTRLIPDAAKQAQEQIKAIVLFGEAPTYEQYKFSDNLEEAKVEFNKNKARFFILENQDYISCVDKDYDSTINNDETKGYYILGADTRIIYRTKPIIFSNDKDIVVNGVIDALSALSLTCFDYNKGKLIETYGNYLIYNQGNQLIDFAESQIVRGVRCNFDLIDTENDDTYSLLTNTKISWIYPVKNTMITPYNLPSAAPAITVEDLTFDLKPIEGSANAATDIYYKKITYTEDYDWTDKVSIYKAPYFLYKIMSSFSPRKTNNFIQCIIEKDGITYHTVQELTFGQAGSAGTEYTFILEALDDLNVLTAGEESSLIVKALLYDSSGKQLDISNKSISWTFVNPQNTSQDISQINGLSYSQKGLTSLTECKIIGTPSMNDLCIIKAVLNDWEEYRLTAFLPIPIRSDKKYLALSGATSVIYLTDGNPQYYESPYEIYANEEISGVVWNDYYSDNANSYQQINGVITQKDYEENKSKYYFKTDNNLYISCENEPWKREYYKRIDESTITSIPELTQEDYEKDPTKYYFKGADGELYQCHKNDPWQRKFYILTTSLGELELVENLTEEEYNKNPDLYYYEGRDEIARPCDVNDPFQKTFYVLKTQETVYNKVTDLTQEEYDENPSLYYFKGYDGSFVPCEDNDLFLVDGATFHYETPRWDYYTITPNDQEEYEDWYENGYKHGRDIYIKNASDEYLKCNEYNIPYEMVYYIKEEGEAFKEVDLTQEEYEQQWDQNSNIQYYYKRKNGEYVNCYSTNEPYVRKYLIAKQNRTEEEIGNMTPEDFDKNKDYYYYRRTDGTYIHCANEPWIREYYQIIFNYKYNLIEPQPSEKDYNLNKDNYYYYQTNDSDNNNPISCSNIPYTKAFYLQNKNLFLPEVKKRINSEGFYYLHPTNLFIQGLPIYGVRGSLDNNIIWTQPILIIQNAYPVAMINQWDGKELKIEGGTILSNRIGVGRKNEQNTFSGVLLGDWEEHSQEGTDLQRYTGIFGFANGIRTYSFLDDGTALIGKNTGGQLKFDGNESTITSASYNDVDGPGIKIDFDDATIAMRGGSNNNHLFTIDASNDTSNDSQALYIGPSSNVNNSYFQVNWDGSATMSGAVITGDTRIQGIFDLGCQVQYGGSQKTLSEVLQAIDNAARAAKSAAENAQNAINLSGLSIKAINNFIGTSKGATIRNGELIETNVATFSYNTDKIPGVKVGDGAVALVGSGSSWAAPGNSLYIDNSGSHFTGPLDIKGQIILSSNVYKDGKPNDSEGKAGRLIFVKEG